MSEVWEEWETKQRKLLGSRLPAINPAYAELACLGPKQRKAIAALNAFQKLFPEKKLFKKFTIEQVKEALEQIGIANWVADLLTELAAKTSRKQPVIDASKEVEEENEA